MGKVFEEFHHLHFWVAEVLGLEVSADSREAVVEELSVEFSAIEVGKVVENCEFGFGSWFVGFDFLDA